MPNTHSTLTALFSDIADSIRGKTGQSGTIVADNFPTAIDGITTPVLQSKSATPSLSTQTITPDSPNNGLSSVSVSAVTKELLATLDSDFKAENIKKDVDLFGLIGTLEGGGGNLLLVTGDFTLLDTTKVNIQHGLGKVPAFWGVIAEGVEPYERYACALCFNYFVGLSPKSGTCYGFTIKQGSSSPFDTTSVKPDAVSTSNIDRTSEFLVSQIVTGRPYISSVNAEYIGLGAGTSDSSSPFIQIGKRYKYFVGVWE